MGRKREKGKARKAKAAAAQLAATQQVSPVNARASAQQQSQWRIWTMVGLTQRCNHGCPVLPAPDHVVSLFMDAMWDRSGVQESQDSFILSTFYNHGQVWDNSTLRKLALDILVAMGTNYIILDTDDHGIQLAGRLAITIFMLEHYNGNGKDDFRLAVCKANLLAGDVKWGGEREIIRFYLKRISCTCLKAKYSLIKKLQPTRISGCVICKQIKVRSSMMLCGRCKVRQYCCEECQAADWPNHKTICRRIGRYLDMESYDPPSDLDDNNDNDEHSDDDDSVGMKKVKDPNALQRNQSSLFHYSNATRNDVKMANPTATSGEIARIISRYFQALSEEERAYWDEKAAQDKIEYTMFDVRLTQGRVFKQLIEALKDLVQEANIDCSDDELSIQAMDINHVALVAVKLRSGGFDHFRCDRPISLGFNSTNMGKILECAGNDDIITPRMMVIHWHWSLKVLNRIAFPTLNSSSWILTARNSRSPTWSTSVQYLCPRANSSASSVTCKSCVKTLPSAAQKRGLSLALLVILVLAMS
jgi:hypothetical protein